MPKIEQKLPTKALQDSEDGESKRFAKHAFRDVVVEINLEHQASHVTAQERPEASKDVPQRASKS